MSEVPEHVTRLADALYETLTTHAEGLHIRDVHVALATFISLALMDGERLLEQQGRYDLAARVRPEFIELLAGP
jgi:hypothetical protein